MWLTRDKMNFDRCPPELGDFPEDCQKAIVAYGKFPDRLQPDIGYLGKDYTVLPQIIEYYNVDSGRLFFDTLLKIDSLFIEKSRKDMEEARRQAKRG